MTDDEVDDYVRFLQEELPPAHRYLSVEQVRAVLDAEAAYYERRFRSERGWRLVLRALFGRLDPSPTEVEAVLPEFADFAMETLAGRDDITPDDIRAVMRVEGEAGPRWAPPPVAPDAESGDG